MEVEISVGKVVLKRPTAGARNKAFMKAETPEGVKQSVLMFELLPYCIMSHPFGTNPVRQSLDNLDIEDYDKLIQALAELINPEAAKKNSE